MGSKRANKTKRKAEEAKAPQMSVVDKLKQGLDDATLAKVGKVAKTHKGRKILEKREG
jgi:hypothetical protein